MLVALDVMFEPGVAETVSVISKGCAIAALMNAIRSRYFGRVLLCKIQR